MITIKNEKEIEILRQGGRKLAVVLDMVIEKARPGVSAKELDKYAEKLIKKNGGRPSFKNFQGYPASLCVSINEVVVHGIPNDNMILKSGDVVGFDIGMQYPAQDGLYTDMARTIGIGKISAGAGKLIKTTERSFYEGIKTIKPGAHIGDIGAAVQAYAEAHGYSVVRVLCGHGVGYEVHELPRIPNFGSKGTGAEIKAGMVLAIEPMICIGSYELQTLADGWSAATQDKSLTSHYENTLVVTKKGCEILTKK